MAVSTKNKISRLDRLYEDERGYDFIGHTKRWYGITAALLVGADDQRDPTALERRVLRVVGERRDLLDALEVLAPHEVDQPAHVVGADDPRVVAARAQLMRALF